MPTNFKYGVSSYGVPVAPDLPAGGNVYYLDPANGSDNFDGMSPERGFKTLTAAYAALTDNNNDILFYIAGSSSISLSAAFTWGKSYTHFIGLAAPTMFNSRARIFQADAATGLSPLITISGSGCIWKNIYVSQGVDDATSLVCVSVTGDRNWFYRCHFAGGVHESNNIDNCASLQLTGGDENTFDECVFGISTIKAETGSNVLRITTQSARDVFKDCIFHCLIDSDGAAAALVELTTTTSVLMFMMFIRCIFLSQSDDKTTSMTSAFVIPSNHTATTTLILQDCVGLGFSKWDADDRNLVYGNTNAITGADTSGILKQLVS